MHRPVTRRGLALSGIAALSAWPVRAQAPVRVGSKPDTEGGLLGNLIIAALQAHAIPTANRIGLGPTRIIRAALLAGEVDLYPEYTGNGAFFFGMDSDPVWRRAAAGYARVKALDLARNHLVWLAPAPADNSWAIAVRGDVAQAHRLASMDDFARWVAGGGTVRLAASAEFVESPAALSAFEASYGFRLKADQILTLIGGNTSVMLRAAAEGISGVNAAMTYGTDGALAVLPLVLMQDTKRAQMVFAPAPVIREDVLRSVPAIADILAPVFASLNAPTLRRLNARIAVEGQAARQVAADYLKKQGQGSALDPLGPWAPDPHPLRNGFQRLRL